MANAYDKAGQIKFQIMKVKFLPIILFFKKTKDVFRCLGTYDGSRFFI